jgi:hypothetical protein
MDPTSSEPSITKRLLKRTRAPHYWRNLGLFTLGVALVGLLVLAIGLARAQAMTFVHPDRIPLRRTPGD